MIDRTQTRKDPQAFIRAIDSMHDALETATRSLRRGAQVFRFSDSKGNYPRIDDLSADERSEFQKKLTAVSDALQDLYAFFGFPEDVPPVKAVLHHILDSTPDAVAVPKVMEPAPCAKPPTQMQKSCPLAIATQAEQDKQRMEIIKVEVD